MLYIYIYILYYTYIYIYYIILYIYIIYYTYIYSTYIKIYYTYIYIYIIHTYKYIYYTDYRWVGHDILLNHTNPILQSMGTETWVAADTPHESHGMIMMILPETQLVKSPFFSGGNLNGYLVGGWPTPLEKNRQLGLLLPINWKKHVPNHQPEIIHSKQNIWEQFFKIWQFPKYTFWEWGLMW